jgi:hypothetical protein
MQTIRSEQLGCAQINQVAEMCLWVSISAWATRFIFKKNIKRRDPNLTVRSLKKSIWYFFFLNDSSCFFFFVFYFYFIYIYIYIYTQIIPVSCLFFFENWKVSYLLILVGMRGMEIAGNKGCEFFPMWRWNQNGVTHYKKLKVRI